MLIIGGTTEGRKAVETLDQAGKPFYYSTRGDEQHVTSPHAIRLVGGMDADEMTEFCRSHGIRLIIDASHPFAVGVHQNVSAAARALGLPAIRYERLYPPKDPSVAWCADYADAIRRLQDDHIKRLLALTGVQTIEKLRPFWQAHETWFRILPRQSSLAIAQSQGFPTHHLIDYPDDQMEEILPDAILTKESGESGGYQQKINQAHALGIPVYVVERPSLPAGFHLCNGPHGLRLLVQRFVPDFFDLHTGLTTGTCATAASIAALTRQSPVQVRIPDGEDIPVGIHQITGDTATVIKPAGDDPDLTDGLEIQACVKTFPQATLQGDDRIIIKGGQGVGTVTLPGLGLPVGSPAINPVPQEMIRTNLLPLLHDGEAAEVTISVPQGAEIGARTFNPRIGVQGGISIIGTSGIVQPFSNEARIESIRREMSVGVATGAGRIVINSGAKSEHFLHAYYPHLPLQCFVHYGNFIGEAIRFAHELGVRHLTLGLMIGKAVKLAEGHLDTHSHKITMNLDFIRLLAQEASVSIPALDGLNMARELWDILSADAMQRFATVIIRHCHEHCAPLLPGGELDILLISENGQILTQQ